MDFISIDFFDFLNRPEWKVWPFNSGYGEPMLPAIARFVFISAILGGILFFLRLLFGPGGPLRDKELDRLADEERAKELAALEEQLKNGEVSEAEYRILKRRIER